MSTTTDHETATTRFFWLDIGTSEQYGWLLSILKALLLLNLLDAIFTLWWVGTGVAVEANALLRDLVVDHPVRFVLTKLGLVSAGSILLWRLRQHPLAVIAIFGAFLVYYLVLLHHLRFWSGPIQYSLEAQQLYFLAYPASFLGRRHRGKGAGPEDSYHRPADSDYGVDGTEASGVDGSRIAD
jgi:hypothetical protein